MDVILGWLSSIFGTLWGFSFTLGTLLVHPVRVVFVCALASFAIGVVLSLVWGNRDAG